MPGKLYIKTFGCQMNEYDSAKMADVLRDSHGMETVDAPEDADVLLLNTCSVREKAQEKVFSLLGRWKMLKQSRPGVVIGVGAVSPARKVKVSSAGHHLSTSYSVRRLSIDCLACWTVCVISVDHRSMFRSRR